MKRVCILLIFFVNTGCLRQNGYRAIPFPTPISSIEPTATKVVETAEPVLAPGIVNIPTNTPIPTPMPTSIVNPFDYFGILFIGENGEPGDPISINIKAGELTFDVTTSPIEEKGGVEFDHNYRSSQNWGYLEEDLRGDIYHLVHSGRNQLLNPYPGERLRAYLEDVDYLRAWTRLDPAEIEQRMQYLIDNADVSITQNEEAINNLQVLNIVRIPPNQVALATDVSLLIRTAAELSGNPSLYIDNPERVIHLVFCGWWTANEEAPENTRWYLWSRYVVTIGFEPD